MSQNPVPPGQPPTAPGWGAPPPPPPGAWPPPPAPKKSGLPKILAIVVGVVVVAAVALFVLGMLADPSGKIQFSKNAYSQDNTCTFSSPVTTISTTDTIYFAAAFRDTLEAGTTVQLEVYLDGKLETSDDIRMDQKVKCYYTLDTVGPLDPGTYKLRFVYQGKEEATGTITVK